MDKLESELDTAQAAGLDHIMWHDDSGKAVPILCSYGRYLVEYLNSELTTPLASRWKPTLN